MPRLFSCCHTRSLLSNVGAAPTNKHPFLLGFPTGGKLGMSWSETEISVTVFVLHKNKKNKVPVCDGPKGNGGTFMYRLTCVSFTIYTSCVWFADLCEAMQTATLAAKAIWPTTTRNKKTVVNGNVQFYSAHPSNVHLSPRPPKARADSAGEVAPWLHLSPPDVFGWWLSLESSGFKLGQRGKLSLGFNWYTEKSWVWD